MSDFVITAKNNPKIKEVRELSASAGKRREKGLFVLEGARLCCDAAECGREIESVFCTSGCEEKYAGRIEKLKKSCKNFYTVSPAALKSMSETVSPQGVVCTVKLTETGFEFKKGGRYIALDNVQNPDNLGAVLRTAEALGIDGAVISGGCDVYNGKALRASMGATLRLPLIVSGDLCAEIKKASQAGIAVFAAVPDRDAVSILEADFGKGALCVIGNEGNGVSEKVLEACNQRLTVRMTGRAESLNAAAAAAIVMWELVK